MSATGRGRKNSSFKEHLTGRLNAAIPWRQQPCAATLPWLLVAVSAFASHYNSAFNSGTVAITQLSESVNMTVVMYKEGVSQPHFIALQILLSPITIYFSMLCTVEESTHYRNLTNGLRMHLVNFYIWGFTL